MEKPYSETDLDAALRVLRAGGIILYPTDTVWGIGCDATNSAAVRRIYALKRRSDSKSMLVLTAGVTPVTATLRSETMQPAVAAGVSPVTATLRSETMQQGVRDERPTTYIYPHVTGVAPELIAEDGSLGIRVTKEAFSKALCDGLGKPIVSTSANISGEPTAKNFSQISEAIRQGVDYICEYRREDEEEKIPSRIVKIMEDGSEVVLRE